MKNHLSYLRISYLMMLIWVSACSSSQIASPPDNTQTHSTNETPASTETISPNITTLPLEPADTIFYNGTLITIEASQPSAEAIAIRNGIIQAVGTNDEILALQGTETIVVDLQGKTMLPGFIDGHTHILAFPSRMGRSLDEAQDTALRYGFTTVNEMWADQGFLDTLLSAEQEGKLRLRVNVFPSYNDGVIDENHNRILLKTWYPGHEPILDPERFLRIPGIKVFIDGDNFSAARGCWALSDPFLPDAPIIGSGVCGTSRGDLYWSQEELNQLVLQAQNGGYRVAFHAMGDGAIETALNSIEYALGGQSNEKYRHQIEHNSMARTDLIPRYEALDVSASVRGYGDFCDLQFLFPTFGPDRAAWYVNRYALPGLEIHAYMETDFGWTIDPDDRFSQRSLDPIMQLYGIVTHKYVNPDGSVCQPDSVVSAYVISIERALQMLTIEPAYAVSMEDYLGSLKPGKYADLIILSDNPLTIDSNQLKDLTVWMTMVNGERSYCSPGREEYCPPPIENEITTPSMPTEPPQFAQVMFNCDEKEGSPVHIGKGNFVQTTIRWAAITIEQVNDYVNAVFPSIMVNGFQIDSNATHGEVGPLEGRDIFFTPSFFDVGVLEPGEYEIRTVLSFTETIFDGYDYYGPGTSNPTMEGTCTVIVE